MRDLSRGNCSRPGAVREEGADKNSQCCRDRQNRPEPHDRSSMAAATRSVKAVECASSRSDQPSESREVRRFNSAARKEVGARE